MSIRCSWCRRLQSITAHGGYPSAIEANAEDETQIRSAYHACCLSIISEQLTYAAQSKPYWDHIFTNTVYSLPDLCEFVGKMTTLTTIEDYHDGNATQAAVVLCLMQLAESPCR